MISCSAILVAVIGFGCWITVGREDQKRRLEEYWKLKHAKPLEAPQKMHKSLAHHPCAASGWKPGQIFTASQDATGPQGATEAYTRGVYIWFTISPALLSFAFASGGEVLQVASGRMEHTLYFGWGGGVVGWGLV